MSPKFFSITTVSAFLVAVPALTYLWYCQNRRKKLWYVFDLLVKGYNMLGSPKQSAEEVPGEWETIEETTSTVDDDQTADEKGAAHLYKICVSTFRPQNVPRSAPVASVTTSETSIDVPNYIKKEHKVPNYTKKEHKVSNYIKKQQKVPNYIKKQHEVPNYIKNEHEAPNYTKEGHEEEHVVQQLKQDEESNIESDSSYSVRYVKRPHRSRYDSSDTQDGSTTSVCSLSLRSTEALHKLPTAKLKGLIMKKLEAR